MNTPTVGILIGGLIYSRIKKNGSDFEPISFYEEACIQYGLSPCFFRLKDITLETNQINALVKGEKGKYEMKVITIPKIIHNRGLFFTNKSKLKIKSLQKTGVIIFNDRNRYGKWGVHEILMKNEELQPHLPETKRASSRNFIEMMEKYKELIIKPNSGSLGGGVVMVEKKDRDLWEVRYRQKREAFTNEWPEIIRKKVLNKNYIIQERIPLTEYQGSPFDLRVSVQKNGLGEWQVTGVVGKVAKMGNYVTNVAKGGTCKTLNELLNEYSDLDFNEVYQSIEDFSIKAVTELNKYFPNLADVGLDIGLTSEGFPMFIECNGRDLRYSFKIAQMPEVWKATYTTPISYARYLFDSKIDEE
ncbi:YheC/YheD family protein [Neobacillus sp. 179-C4.2 HS]|uniref:YheC/YheD family protein n=1 Tax=Neobacillus driksii TaxID=3035913 RepID=A0ABV4YW55_9BACI|nr:YheC/YheD family protein [Neobacillus sp. 179.-C4.2 HS]MDP5196497.1 YheC/YheD family protein [Neobacillus sp. 179.-C4.2 HS]